MEGRITLHIFIIFLLNSYAYSSIREKRLILHSSEDVYNEIQNLKSEIQTLQSNIQNLQSENANMKVSLEASNKGMYRFYYSFRRLRHCI